MTLTFIRKTGTSSFFVEAFFTIILCLVWAQGTIEFIGAACLERIFMNELVC
jgi:hypothetical protein